MQKFTLDTISQTVGITRWKDGVCCQVEDTVAEEVFIRILINGSVHGSLDCSPWELDELAVGYLYTEGVLQNPFDIESLQVENDTVSVQLRQNADRAPLPPSSAQPLCFTAEDVTRLMEQMENSSHLFRHTGGVHSAALTDGHTILASCEDVGRRNALDRLVGRCLLRGIPMAGMAVLFSGRVPEEVVRKAACVGCGAIFSVSAPTSRGILAAREEQILLAGFVRGNRFNVYTFPERIQSVP